MSDEIYLQPAKAGETLLQMQNLLKDFNKQIHEMGAIIKTNAAVTYSEPLLKAMTLAAHDLNNLGHAANAAIYAFSHAFVDVIEEWKKTDAQAAASVSFSKPHLEDIRLVTHASRKLHVDIEKIKIFITHLDGCNDILKSHFDDMDALIRDSVHYWRGDSASHTRETWRRRLEPVMDNTYKTVQKVVEIMREELHAFIKRDAQNFPGRW